MIFAVALKSGTIYGPFAMEAIIKHQKYDTAFEVICTTDKNKCMKRGIEEVDTVLLRGFMQQNFRIIAILRDIFYHVKRHGTVLHKDILYLFKPQSKASCF
jgi:hypothetical protein